MSDVTFTITGLDELRVTLARLSNPSQFRALVHACGLIIETAFKKYPTRNSPSRASVYGTAFQSDRQQRWFFWALRAGAVDVPYRRGQSGGSRNLQQSWTTLMETDTRVVVGTNVPYAQLVMGETQSKYMAAVGWRTVTAILPTVEPQVKAGLEAGIAKILQV